MDILMIDKNLSNILTYIEASIIGIREYELIKQLAQTERSSLEQSLEIKLEDNFIVRKILEETLETKYRKTKANKKQVLIANALLPNDKEIASILNDHNFSIQELKDIIRFRDKLKQILTDAYYIDKEISKIFEIYKEKVSTLIEIFKSHFGIKDPTIILNRICEMLISNPELFETKHYPKEKRLNQR